jgi:hypothetical protein
MNTNNTTRRQLIATAAGAGLGILLTNRASAQSVTPNSGSISALDAGTIHREAMIELSNVLGSASAATKEGMLKIVNYLREKRVINENQAAIITDVINAIFESVNADNLPDLDKMYNAIQAISERAGKAAEDVGAAIANIARESVIYAKEHIKNADAKTIRDVISSDVEGATWGAGIGAKLGARFMVAGAVLGAAGSSGWEAFRHGK